MGVIIRIVAGFLFLVAFLTGGCSVFFGFVALTDPAGDAILPIVMTGFAVGGASFFAGRFLWRRTRKGDATPPSDTTR